MFERYTEKARRVIFFARYEASEYGSPYIETEHLLLGLMREDPALTRRILHAGRSSEPSTDSIRRKISERGRLGEKLPTSVDLPLSNESKRVLAYAAEEAERLSNKHIGTEHLLLGLLREKKSYAAQLLNEESVVLERARENIGEWQKKHGIEEETPGLQTVTIHGQEWKLTYVQAQVSALSKFAWRKREWRPLDALLETETSRVCFDTAPPDDPRFKFVPKAWRRDWCLICNWELSIDAGDEHSIGYTNGRQWLCIDCYERFFATNPQ
jgi:ATP-dependent Clp protease ATP-binding subunit ClpA